MIYAMMVDIHSKSEYFHEQLQTERQKMNRYQQEFRELRDNISNKDIACQKCWSSLSYLDFDHIINHVLENHRPVKKAYNDTLDPLQQLLIFICLFNTICLVNIFKRPSTLFYTSHLFTIICLFIQGEIFIKDKPNVYYTLIMGVGIFLFSLFVLIKILITLLNILHYQRMKEILTSDISPDMFITIK
jgi:hypothetical protein